MIKNINCNLRVDKHAQRGITCRVFVKDGGQRSQSLFKNVVSDNAQGNVLLVVKAEM